MKFLTKPFYIKLRLRDLLILFLCAAFLVIGFFLYKSYAFHNLFFRSLSENKIESVYIYDRDGQSLTALEDAQIAQLVPLLRNIRLTEEPYVDFGVLGDYGNDFQIRLKSGIVLELNVYGGEPACYIINGESYPVQTADIESLHRLEVFYKNSLALKTPHSS